MERLYFCYTDQASGRHDQSRLAFCLLPTADRRLLTVGPVLWLRLCRAVFSVLRL
jgi:hypothetical protein